MAVFLRDVDYTIQFYASGAFQDPNMEVELNREYWVSAPLITALPYWFRLQQCVRRFYDAGERRETKVNHATSSLMRERGEREGRREIGGEERERRRGERGEERDRRRGER
eukprot:132937-Hanusia_phi.AAC.1